MFVKLCSVALKRGNVLLMWREKVDYHVEMGHYVLISSEDDRVVCVAMRDS